MGDNMEDKHLELLIRIDERVKATDEKIDILTAGQKLQNGKLAEHNNYIIEHKEYHSGKRRTTMLLTKIIGILIGVAGIIIAIIEL